VSRSLAHLLADQKKIGDTALPSAQADPSAFRPFRQKPRQAQIFQGSVFVTKRDSIQKKGIAPDTDLHGVEAIAISFAGAQVHDGFALGIIEKHAGQPAIVGQNLQTDQDKTDEERVLEHENLLVLSSGYREPRRIKEAFPF
jgi:hypothetical protein